MSIAKKLTLVSANVCALLLTGCAPSPIDTEDARSTALVEKFFAHLEAGEATEAAALTDMELADEFVDDSFYRASAALPSDAHIVDTDGSDAIGLTVTVEYTLDEPAVPVILSVRVSPRDGHLKIAGWEGGSPITIGPANSPGTVTVNGTREYAVADEGNVLTLLPGAYRAEYHDPTGLTDLIGQESTFTAIVPVQSGNGGRGSARLNATPALRPDVESGLLDAIDDLQVACAEEHFIGPSCPEELIEVRDQPLDASVTAEWYRDPGPEIRFVDGSFQAVSSYTIRFSDDTEPTMTVSYSGTLTRDSANAIALVR